jgi:hypothetical protein
VLLVQGTPQEPCCMQNPIPSVVRKQAQLEASPPQAACLLQGSSARTGQPIASHWQVLGLRCSVAAHKGRHSPPQHSVPSTQQLLPQVWVPVGHSHLQVVGLKTLPPLQVLETQALLHTTCPVGHSHLQVVWLTTSPVFEQVTHWLPAGHSVLPVGQPHILPFPFGFLIHWREQHWVLAVHLLKGCLHAAQAAPGMEAKAPPTKAAPSIRSALPRERVPLASPLARSSKEDASVASRLVWVS